MKTFQEHIIKTGSKYRLVSKTTGRNLGTYPTKAGAEKRERQVQYFKHTNEASNKDKKAGIISTVSDNILQKVDNLAKQKTQNESMRALTRSINQAQGRTSALDYPERKEKEYSPKTSLKDKFKSAIKSLSMKRRALAEEKKLSQDEVIEKSKEMVRKASASYQKGKATQAAFKSSKKK